MATTTGPDVATLISEQHATIRRLLDEVQAAMPDARGAAFDPLVRLLAVHETAEEEIVYPALRTLGDEGTAVVEARTAEEDAAKKALAALEGLEPQSQDFAEAFADFRVAVQTHAASEERDVLPLLARTAPDRRRAMGDLFLTAEAMAPTHAHRLAPESAIGNVLVGPFVAMVDRVRDAIHGRTRP